MRIGLYGGTFDPIHHAHLIVARAVRELAGLDEVWLLPAFRQPLKTGQDVTPGDARLAMIRLAIAGEPGLSVCDAEIRRGGLSYTIDTLTQLASEHPEHELSWILGADSLTTLHHWRRAHELIDTYTIWIAARPGFDADRIRRGLIEHLGERRAERLLNHLCATPQVDISSTQIRDRVRQRLSIRYLVPEAVSAYIASHCLYASSAS